MKKVFYIIMFITLFLCNSVFATNYVFSDLPENHWAYNAVNKMVMRDVINGYPDGTFKPNGTITRVEFAKIMVKALELKEVNNDIIFLDVDDEFWGNEYIDKAKNYLGWYKLESEYAFYPNELAVREDMAVALVKAIGLEDEEDNVLALSKFTDSDKITNNNRKYMEIAIEKGIINGYDDNTIRPQGTLTRAEAIQLIVNVLENSKIEPMKPDVTQQQDIRLSDGESKILKEDIINILYNEDKIYVHETKIDTVSKIKYYFDNDKEEYSINNTSAILNEIIEVPSKYKDGEEHILYMFVERKDGSYSKEWVEYHFKFQISDELQLLKAQYEEDNNVAPTKENWTDSTIYVEYSNILNSGEICVEDQYGIVANIKKTVVSSSYDGVGKSGKGSGRYLLQYALLLPNRTYTVKVTNAIDIEGNKAPDYIYTFKTTGETESNVIQYVTLGPESREGGNRLDLDRENNPMTKEWVIRVKGYYKGERINKIEYKFDYEKPKTIYSSETIIEMPDNLFDGKSHKLSINLRTTSGNISGWKNYYFIKK